MELLSLTIALRILRLSIDERIAKDLQKLAARREVTSYIQNNIRIMSF